MPDPVATFSRAGLMGPRDKSKLDKWFTVANTDPTLFSDSERGFFAGARWFNQASNKEFVCIDASVGAAVWKSPA